MEIIYPFIVVIVLLLIVIILISEIRNKRTAKLLLNFKKQNLQEVEIKLSQTTYNKFNQFGGICKKAKLYFDTNEKIIVLTTNKNSISSVLNNNLPLILKNKKTNLAKTEVDFKTVDKIITKSDEYILIIKDNFSKNKRIEIEIFSEKNGKQLNEIITEFNI
jgi:hypothetical protein